MGQVSVTAFRAVPLPELQTKSTAQTERAHAQAVASAVHVINRSALVGADREVTFSTDSATKTLVVSLVDKQSKEVIVQWPSDYALQMAQDYQKEHPDK